MGEHLATRGFLDRMRGVSNVAKAAERMIAKATAYKFRYFSLFDLNEMTLSRLIAFLLDPSQTHGQGATFLKLFLREAGLPDASGDRGSTQIWTEDTLNTGNGRVDIRVHYAIEGTSVMHLVIENKPWAGDGEDQIARYVEHLEIECNNQDNWHIIYIPPTAREPTERAINQNQLRTLTSLEKITILPYVAEEGSRSIVHWLKSCAGQCEAAGPRGFIRDFISYIEENLSGEGRQHMGDTEQEISRMVLGFLQNSEEDLEVAIEVEKALRSLREQLAMGVGESILQQLKQALGSDWEVSSDFGRGRYSGLKIRRNNWQQGQEGRGQNCQYWVGFEFRGGSWEDAKYGLSCQGDVVSSETFNRLRGSVRGIYPELRDNPRSWVALSTDLAGIPTNWMCDDFLRFARRLNSGAPGEVSIVNSFIKRLVNIARIVDQALAPPG